MHSNIHLERTLLNQKCGIRDYLERDEKKLVYKSIFSRKKQDLDPQLVELGVISKTPLSTNRTKLERLKLQMSNRNLKNN